MFLHQKMIYADEQQIGVHQEICGGHHQICADVTKGFVGARKLVHLDKFVPPKRGCSCCVAKQFCNPRGKSFLLIRILMRFVGRIVVVGILG